MENTDSERQRWEQPCWANTIPHHNGSRDAPSSSASYCWIIKHAAEAEAQREAKAAHSYQLPHHSHLVGQQRGIEEPIPHSVTRIRVPGEAATVNTLLNPWSTMGLSSANLAKLCSKFSQKAQKLETQKCQPSMQVLRDFLGAVTAISCKLERDLSRTGSRSYLVNCITAQGCLIRTLSKCKIRKENKPDAALERIEAE